MTSPSDFAELIRRQLLAWSDVQSVETIEPGELGIELEDGTMLLVIVQEP